MFMKQGPLKPMEPKIPGATDREINESIDDSGFKTYTEYQQLETKVLSFWEHLKIGNTFFDSQQVA